MYRHGLGYIIGAVLIVGGLLVAWPIAVVGVLWLVMQPAGDAAAQPLQDAGGDSGVLGCVGGVLLPLLALALFLAYFATVIGGAV